MSKIILSTSGTVKYRIKDPNAKNETSIVLDYSFGRNNRIKFATGYKVKPKNWDKINQRIRSISTIKNREKVNGDLLRFTSEFLDAVSRLSEIEKQNKNNLKALLFKIIRKTETNDNPIMTFFEFADDYIERKENQARNMSTVKLSPITVRSYKQTINRLKEFNNKSNYNLDFQNIDLKFYYAFLQYLEDHNYSINTIGKHIKNLVTVLNRATEDGVNKYLKYKHSEFKTVSMETFSIYLTEFDIDALFKVDLSKNKKWELARDIFLIGYYTGQRISDYNGIKKEQIKKFEGKEVFEFNQQKTDKRIYVPIHFRVKEIINKRYNGFPPPKLNNPDINEFIKEAGREAEINEQVVVCKKIGGKVITNSVPKYSLIVSHSARRSFCSNAYLSKMPVIDIMSISGHSTEREFYKYIKVTPQERAVKIADSDFFKN
ncbi:site-specific integrase [Tenacibaculum piscium]|uniref:site-specific integrase n=1 Tax=Tenacibaculum piscium TaxID=1458515 RepID=UPI001EFB87ED|nr:site-specific integrase [Tenacibaculum piscium]MCG8182766.1 site-specific integrase [Tenacibaculum piscium]MCG8204158.1 site-specific integrase [Tenacibaculum piscium]